MRVGEARREAASSLDATLGSAGAALRGSELMTLDGHATMHTNMRTCARGRTSGIQQVGDDLERIALVDEELLALGGVEHLLRVPAHQRVEERVELARARRARLCLCAR